MNQNPFEAPASEPEQVATLDSATDDGRCPICRNYAGMKRPELLYGYDVCPTCSWNFAWSRRAAFIFDSILFFGTWTLLSFWLMSMTRDKPFRQTQLTLLAAYFLWNLTFFFKDGLSGRSLGKLIFGLAVIDRTTGQRGGLLTSLKRYWPFWCAMFVTQGVNASLVATQGDPFAINFYAVFVTAAFGLCHLALYIVVSILLGGGFRWGDGFGRSKVIWVPYAKSPVFRPNLRKADHLA